MKGKKMKKILLLWAIVLMAAPAVYASRMGDPCGSDNSGTVLVGTDGTTTYCVSNQKMNWWSVFSWCEMAGGTMASLGDCALGSAVVPNCGCPQFCKGDGLDKYVWIDAVPGESHAFTIHLRGAFRDIVARGGKSPVMCRGNF